VAMPTSRKYEAETEAVLGRANHQCGLPGGGSLGRSGTLV